MALLRDMRKKGRKNTLLSAQRHKLRREGPGVPGDPLGAALGERSAAPCPLGTARSSCSPSGGTPQLSPETSFGRVLASHGHPAPGSPLPQLLGFRASAARTRGQQALGEGTRSCRAPGWSRGGGPGPALPPSPARRAPAHAASGAEAEALVIKEPLLRSAIQPQGGFMQNDTQYK